MQSFSFAASSFPGKRRGSITSQSCSTDVTLSCVALEVKGGLSVYLPTWLFLPTLIFFIRLYVYVSSIVFCCTVSWSASLPCCDIFRTFLSILKMLLSRAQNFWKVGTCFRTITEVKYDPHFNHFIVQVLFLF